jgi:hypothetical protein
VNRAPITCFDPEMITVLSRALEDARTTLPPVVQDSVAEGETASLVLKLAAQGERDPVRLCTYAVLQSIRIATNRVLLRMEESDRWRPRTCS